MSKNKIREVARELGESAGALLKSVGGARQDAQSYLASLMAVQERISDEEARRDEEARLSREAEAYDREQAEISAAEAAQEAAIKAAVLAARRLEKREETTLKVEGTPRPANREESAVEPVQSEGKSVSETAVPEAEKPKEQPKEQSAQAPRQQTFHPPQGQQRPPVQQGVRNPQNQVGGQQRPPMRSGGMQRNAPRPFVPHPDDPNAAANRAKFANQPGGAQAGAPRPGMGGAPRPGMGGQGGFRQGGAGGPGGQGGFRQGGAGGPGGQGNRFGGGNAGGGGAGPRGGFGGRSKAPEITPTQEKERVSNYDPNKSAYQRAKDPENKPTRARKSVIKENIARAGDDEFTRGGKKRRKQPQRRQKIEPIKIEKAYMTAETVTVKDLTERLGKPAGEIIKKLLLLGIMATINQELDFDTAQLVAQEFGIEFELKLEKTAEDALMEEQVEITDEDESKLIMRAPVVAVMGHVDHGKTSLLDAIRRTSVTATEAGGITQHIGAYQVEAHDELITFLDTPGHEAFTSMRMRGGQAADIVILVVSAEDGVMPQTVEAISHAKAAKVTIIVAINKIDLPDANPERVKQELTEYELVSEEWGGETIFVPVSAKMGEGIDQLLEMVLLSAEVMDLKANPDRQARGVIIEAQLDKGRGPVATVLVQNGTLRVGDTIVAGTAYGRVRAMVNDKGERVNEAGPSTPVEVIGFNDVPDAGDTMSVAQDDRLSRMVAEERRNKIKVQQMKTMSKASLDDLFTQMRENEIKDLNLVVKADVQGSVEAVRQAMEKLSNDEVRVKCIHGGVGAITINDVMLASVANAIIIGFNVRPDNAAREAAERENVDVRLYRVIYHATEEIQAAMKGLLTPQYREVALGAAQVRQVFKVTGSGTIAGSYVTSGDIRRNAQARLVRDGVVVYESKIESIRRFKDDVREVHSGYECGISLENYSDIKEGDIIECFIMEEIER